ncbi:DUF443 family protein [Lactobacillus sp. YT155]|uniref:DUF443 family protein n=1 Tax=Lactobacillus sp. YT155 TaxID=3060955 RepID=UPI00265EE821|nr:DUF443 family protein [Lactobacillus sp. YT155]MDO1604815.1 DUF443 family protein [Lactobacillus sp. YT155]
MSKIEVQSEPLTGNRRYIILNTADKHYLVDVNMPPFLIQLFPFLVWIVRHKCYEITTEQWNELSGPRVGQSRNWTPWETGMLAIGANFFITPRLIQYTNVFKIKSWYIIFFSGIVGLVIVRYFLIHRNKVSDSYFDENKVLIAKIKFASVDTWSVIAKYILIVVAVLGILYINYVYAKDSLVTTSLSLVGLFIYSMINEELWKWNLNETYLEIDN